jgi:predicted PurR-regulated permease PerM
MTPPRSDLARNTLGVLFIAGLILVTLWVLRPFIGPTIWAATIVVASWPLMRRLQARLGGRRWAAVLLMTLALLALFILPVTMGAITVVQHVDQIVEFAKRLSGLRLSAPPDWLLSLPLAGPKLGQLWEQAVAAGAEGLLDKLRPYAGQVTRWFVGQVGTVGFLLVQSLLVPLLAALMYADGESAVSALRQVGRRLAGEQGEAVVVLAGQAIRGVALGVGVTAMVQSGLGGIGLAISGVPYAGLLTVVMFMLCLAQLGPMPVLVPVVIWMYWSGHGGWGTFLLVITVVAGTIDNVVRPILIRMGADLPLLLIFSGVVGGLLAFGLVGIFIGPVVLAVAYRLLQAWVTEQERPAAE